MSETITCRCGSVGDILHTTTCGPKAVARKERRHLAKMDTGEWALVESWESQGDWGYFKRLYIVHNRIGSHPTVEEALARFDEWVGPALSVPAGMPES